MSSKLNKVSSLRNTVGAMVCVGLLSLSSIASATADTGLTRFNDFMTGVKTLEATFTQEVVSENGNIGRTSLGTIYLSRPGKFRWEYETPIPQKIISDGKKIWVYDEELEQVTVKNIDSALGASPAAILMSSGAVAKDFNVVERPAREGLKWVELKPKVASRDFNRILVGMDDRGVQGMDLYDQFGRITMIRFQESEMNPRISNKMFAFKPPPGTDVIGQ